MGDAPLPRSLGLICNPVRSPDPRVIPRADHGTPAHVDDGDSADPAGTAIEGREDVPAVSRDRGEIAERSFAADLHGRGHGQAAGVDDAS
jgi:hypothetical protein